LINNGKYLILQIKMGDNSMEFEMFDEERNHEVRNAIWEIADIYLDHSFFWKNAAGWAPDEANKILAKSRLDWLHSLSEALYIWTETYRTFSNNEGKLILSWANLGALLEGGLKLFFSIHYMDYKKSPNKKLDKKGNIKDPDLLALEELKVLIQKDKIFAQKWIDFIQLVQIRRNAIHAYKHREIGDWEEFFDCVETLRDFTIVIKDRLPYPY
jgi:hypothetical protein